MIPIIGWMVGTIFETLAMSVDPATPDPGLTRRPIGRPIASALAANSSTITGLFTISV